MAISTEQLVEVLAKYRKDKTEEESKNEIRQSLGEEVEIHAILLGIANDLYKLGRTVGPVTEEMLREIDLDLQHNRLPLVGKEQLMVVFSCLGFSVK